MKASDIPSKFNIPFANSAGGGYIRSIPQASQIGIVDGAASLTDGFPPLNFLAVGAGGIPPFGQDFNGLMKWVTQWAQWQGLGGPETYDSSYQAAVGGYPKGAIVQSVTTFGTFWLCTVDNNVTNPDTGGAGWTTWPSAQSLIAAKVPFNLQKFQTSTRVTMSGVAGNSWTVTPWTGITYVKVLDAATSSLKLIATFPTFTPGASGSAQGVLSIGGTNLVFVPSNNTAALSYGQGAVIDVISGLPAGALSMSLSFKRNDSADWTGTFCFNNTDASSYPVATKATIVIEEVPL